MKKKKSKSKKEKIIFFNLFANMHIYNVLINIYEYA